MFDEEKEFEFQGELDEHQWECDSADDSLYWQLDSSAQGQDKYRDEDDLGYDEADD